MLDLGCGSGRPIAHYLIAQGFTVTGVDSSGPAGSTTPAGCRGPPHEWIEADMRGLDLDRAFDGLIAWHSFFHLSPEDQRGLFPVFARHVAPGGALMFTGGPRHGEVIADWNGEELYHGSLSSEEYSNVSMRPGSTSPPIHSMMQAPATPVSGWRKDAADLGKPSGLFAFGDTVFLPC